MARMRPVAVVAVFVRVVLMGQAPWGSVVRKDRDTFHDTTAPTACMDSFGNWTQRGPDSKLPARPLAFVIRLSHMISVDAIRAGLTQGEFFLEYLPTVTLAEERCVGGEALARWRRASGVVPPGKFIPLIEETPVSGLLTYWVIETVTKE